MSPSNYYCMDLIFHHCDIISFDLNYYYSSYSIELCTTQNVFLVFARFVDSVRL